MRRLLFFVALFVALTLTATPVPGQQPSSTTAAQPATMTVVLRSNGMVVATTDAAPTSDPQVISSVTVSPSTMIVVKDGTLVPVPATAPADTAAVRLSDQPAAPTKLERNADGSTTETILDGNGKPIVAVRRAGGTPPSSPK